MPTADRKLRVFLCYASQDKPVVRELYQKLSTEGWIEPWLDEEMLLPGQDWDLEIEKAVQAADAVVVCLSNTSVTKEGYVQKEIKKVLDISDQKPEGTIFTIPLRLDDCQPTRRLQHLHYVDYFPKEQRELTYQKLSKSLRIRADVLDITKDTPQNSDQDKHTSYLFRHGDLSIDSSRFEVRKGQFHVDLSFTEYRMLLYFAQNIGKIISSEDLLTNTWGPEYRDEKEILRISIARLRQKLEDDPHSPKHIVSHSGVGYLMPSDKK